MKAYFRQAIRRWRNWLDRKRWQATRRFRQSPQEVAEFDPLIAQAVKAHARQAELIEARKQTMNERLRRISQ